MDVLNTIRIHSENYPVTNLTDYFLTPVIYSDYGFELQYRAARRGVQEYRWQSVLSSNGFAYNGVFGSINGLHHWETRRNELDLAILIDRPVHLRWWSGDNLYQILFDGSEFLVEYGSGPILELSL